jgi:hypothetical protein
MFKKTGNKSLGIVFVVLLLIVVIIYFGSDKNERTFREVLVNIDSSAVTKMLIYSKSNNFQPTKIFKENDRWRVELNDGKTAPVTNQKMQQILQELISIVPKRLTARDEAKWKEFQVDSSGTRVQVFEGEEPQLDIIIGRFNYQQQPRSISSYVRLNNDIDVYEVDGFLAITFNQNADTFRDGTIIKDDSNNWKQIKFDYPADSSFTLTKLNNKWYIDNIETDSTGTANYLRTLSNFSKNNFADESNVTSEQSATYKLTISNNNLEFIELKAFKDSDNFVITSSQNPETKFDGKTFLKTLFVNKELLLK